MIPQFMATEIAVRTLSPVAMMASTPARYKVMITPFVASFSLFSITSRPKKVKSDSTYSRLTGFQLVGSSLYARAITR